MGLYDDPVWVESNNICLELERLNILMEYQLDVDGETSIFQEATDGEPSKFSKFIQRIVTAIQNTINSITNFGKSDGNASIDEIMQSKTIKAEMASDIDAIGDAVEDELLKSNKAIQWLSKKTGKYDFEIKDAMDQAKDIFQMAKPVVVPIATGFGLLQAQKIRLNRMKKAITAHDDSKVLEVINAQRSGDPKAAKEIQKIRMYQTGLISKFTNKVNEFRIGLGRVYNKHRKDGKGVSDVEYTANKKVAHLEKLREKQLKSAKNMGSAYKNIYRDNRIAQDKIEKLNAKKQEEQRREALKKKRKLEKDEKKNGPKWWQ